MQGVFLVVSGYHNSSWLSVTRTRLQRHSRLACLEIRSRNEETINSTRNMIYSQRFFTSYFIDVDTFYLFLNWFSTRASDKQNYLCDSKLRLFTVFYFSVRSSRSSAFRYGLPSCKNVKTTVPSVHKTRYISTISRKNRGLWTDYSRLYAC